MCIRDSRLIAERLTGTPQDGFVSQAMAHGSATEPEARAAYEFYKNCNVEELAFAPHPTIAGSHASPDGLVGEDGLTEFKCCATATHIDLLLGAGTPEKYIIQCQWQMAVTGRKWNDLTYFDPRMPEEMRLHIRRIHRDDTHIAELEDAAREFLSELNEKLQRLRQVVGMREAA